MRGAHADAMLIFGTIPMRMADVISFDTSTRSDILEKIGGH